MAATRARPSFGAHPMGVDGGIDPITHHGLSASYGHNGYFDPGSESLRNLALISIDRRSLAFPGARQVE